MNTPITPEIKELMTDYAVWYFVNAAKYPKLKAGELLEAYFKTVTKHKHV
jgi:hypothetical protein